MNSGRRQSYDFSKPPLDENKPLSDLIQRPSSSQHMQNTSNFGGTGSQLENYRQSSIDRFQKPASIASLPQTPNGATSSMGLGNVAANGGNMNMKSSSSLGMGQSNADLYKQLDGLREENFQLKQKQRELMLSLNTVKSENEQLLDNAESEIKRMSDFIDKFTGDAEQTKKRMVADFEQKLSQERIRGDEQRQRMTVDKAEQEARILKMQKEIEQLKQDNIQLQLAKSDAMQKQIDMFEQLEQTKQQLRQVQAQLMD